MTIREFIVLLLLTAAVLAAGMVAFSGVGRSQERVPCHPAAALSEVMAKEYGEQLFAIGAADPAGTVRIYVNPESRTWTVFAVTPGQLACPLAAGKAFDFARPKPAGQAL